MGRLSGSDLRSIFGFLGSAPIGGRFDPVPRRSLVLLRDVLGADSAEYFELRRSDRAVIGAARSDDIVPAPGSDGAMHAYGDQNPLNWRRWGPADGARRLSEQVRRSEFARTGFYDGFMRPNRLRDTLKVWLAASADSAACVQLWRTDGDFSRREQDVLAVLHRHLIDMRGRSLAGMGAPEVIRGLTVREAEILTWAARGDSDAEIATRLGTATATVRKHLENAYATLGVHSRAEAIGRILVSDTHD